MSWFIYAGVALLVYQAIAIDNKRRHHKAGGKTKLDGGALTRKQAAALLEVNLNADEVTIRRAYQKKVRQYHPDLVANAADEIRALAEKRTKAINAAYDLLVKNRA